MSTVLISAGDASGDVHAAGFARVLAERRPGLRIVGMGGPELARGPAQIVADQRDRAVGGLLAVAGSRGRARRAWRGMGAALEAHRPDLVVLIDSGGFNIPFAARVRQRLPSARILYYVAPQVWAWRSWRIRKLAARVDRMAVIFPFEPEVYAGSGLDVRYVGHPLVESISAFAEATSEAAARAALGIEGRGRVVTLLPGSRRNEVAHQLGRLLEAARLLHGRHPDLRFLLAEASSLSDDAVAEQLERTGLPDGFPLVRVCDRTHLALRAADVCLAKPGTVTIEATLLGCPMVVMGIANPISAAIVRSAMHVPYFAMPNLMAGREVVPELIQEAARPEAIAERIEGLLEGSARREQQSALEALRKALGKGGGAAEGAVNMAEELLDRVA